jgi:endonuclease YncB( thermonuclease family)
MAVDLSAASRWRRGRNRVLLFGCALLLGAASARAASVLEGSVTRVSDGDTLWLRPTAGARPVKVRVAGIDAPERCQAWGPQATQALSSRVLHRHVRIEGDGRNDDHGRRLGRLVLNGEDVGERLVRDGHAWSYRFRRDVGPYAPQERAAQAARRGLHADAAAIHPRDFRRSHGPCE